jgi:hypothetical protein
MMSDKSYLPTRDEWEAAQKELIILQLQINKLEVEHNERWKLIVLIGTLGYDVIKNDDGSLRLVHKESNG